MHFDCQRIVVYFCTTILGGTVGTGGLDDIVEFLEHHRSEVRVPGKLAALIRPKDTVGDPELCHEGPEDGQGGFLGFGEEP